MLEQEDIKAIGQLLDEKLKVNNKTLKDEIVAEIGAAVNAGFNDMEAKFEVLQEEMAKRPTRNEIFDWADRRIDDLELRADRHDFLHINELDNLPPQGQISQALLERGFKKAT
jgi:hypothetical protein